MDSSCISLQLLDNTDDLLKLAGAIGSFLVSLALFVPAYFTLDEGYVWLLYGVGGIILAVIGVFIAMSKK